MSGIEVNMWGINRVAMMARHRPRKQWPITRWFDSNGKANFRVEDDQGYNFSFSSRKDAEEYRAMCNEFNDAMDEKESEIVKDFRRSLRA